MSNQTPDPSLRSLEEPTGWVAVSFLDYNGLARARSIAAHRYEEAERDGINFSSPTVEFNPRDVFPPDAVLDLASPDVWAKPDPSTRCAAPWLEDSDLVWSDLVDAGGKPWTGCPRSALRRQLQRAEEMGMWIQAGFEPEGYIFQESTGGVEFLGPPEFATLDGLAFERQYVQDLLSSLSRMGLQVEQWTKEYGPGQIEVNLRYAPALRAADNLASFRMAFRGIAHNYGLIGTFMPKPFETQAGSGLHVHLSATSRIGDDNLFAGDADQLGLSRVGRHALAGLIEHGDALVALGCSTVNSYKRLLPGSWSPTHIGYSYASRAAFIRVPELHTPRRLEIRVADGACNPYLYLAGLVAAMLDGIERELQPPAATAGDVGALPDAEAQALGLRRIPSTLGEALYALEKDSTIMTALGPLIGPEYLKMKRSEWDAFRLHVSQWDRDWYLRRF